MCKFSNRRCDWCLFWVPVLMQEQGVCSLMVDHRCLLEEREHGWKWADQRCTQYSKRKEGALL